MISDHAKDVLDGISKVESGHRYSAVGPITRSGHRAYGRYQVMAYNVPTWTKQILGRALTVEEFLADHEAQDLVAGFMFTERLKTYSVEDTVSLWFSGQPYAGNNASDGNLTVPQYVLAVINSL